MKEKLVWIGPRESDILYSNINFYRSVTYNGNNTGNNVSLTSRLGTRINHISDAAKWNLSDFLKGELYPLLDDPDVRFLFYNPMQSYLLGNDFSARTLCLNEQSLLTFFRDKSNMRKFAQDCIPIVPYVNFTGPKFPNLSFNIGDKNTYILQKVFSSSGQGTHQLSISDCIRYVQTNSEAETYIISPYLEYAVPINVHVVIFKQITLILPPSYQLIEHFGSRFSYLGGDFHSDFSFKSCELIIQRTVLLAEKLRMAGYRGVCGIDYLMTDDELYFLEINTRFQASTFLLNKLLAKENKLSLHQLNLIAFSGGKAPFESFLKFSEPEAFFTVSGNHFPKWYQGLSRQIPSVITEIILDGFTPEMGLSQGAYLFRAVTSRNLSWKNEDSHLQLAPNITQDPIEWRERIITVDPLSLKIALLNQGVCFSSEAEHRASKCGMIRQGVFQSVDLTLPNGLIINAPCHTDFSELTPYHIEWNGTQFLLCYEDNVLSPVAFDSADPYQQKTAVGGTLFRNAAFWATDRLRVHHQFHCSYKTNGIGCRFCNVKHKTGTFLLEDVCEVIDFYLEHTDFRHFLIGGGSGEDSSEPQNIIELARHIRSRSDKPIYSMCLPPKDLSVLSEYYNAGINEISFNLELFNREIAKKIMPGKGSIPLSQYESAYREAVRLWGNHGAVRSLMVLGLEPIDSFYQGIEWLCQLGVMPIISVFRPMNNIALKEVLPPSNMALAHTFPRILEITSRYNLIPGPFCVACQNNTLSLPQSFLSKL